MKMPVASTVRSPIQLDQPTAERADGQSHQGEDRDHRADLGVADPEAAGEHRQHRHQHPEADGHAEGDQAQDQHVTGQGGTLAQPTADGCGEGHRPSVQDGRGLRLTCTRIPWTSPAGRREEELDGSAALRSPDARSHRSRRARPRPSRGRLRRSTPAAGDPADRGHHRHARPRSPTEAVPPGLQGRRRLGLADLPGGRAALLRRLDASASCPRSSSRWPWPSCWRRC